MSQFLSVICSCLGSLPKDYHIIVKEHPRNVISNTLTEYLPIREQITFIREEVNANALTQGCEVVLTINSGISTEALVFHKPVISLGKSFYSDKGLNFEAHNVSELQELFRNIAKLNPPTDLIDIFIYHFIHNFTCDLTTEEDTLRLVKLIEETAT